MTKNSEINKYIKQVKTLLPVYSKKEKRYLRELRNSVSETVRRKPDAAMSDIIEEHGAPPDVVHDYIDSLDIDYVLKRIAARRVIKKIFTTTIIVLIVSLGVFTIVMHKTYLEFKKTIVTSTQTVIQDE